MTASEMENGWIVEATISEMRQRMDDDEITAEQLVLIYLERIAQQNAQCKAILEVNPDAVHIARALDAERKQQGNRSVLHGIPILIKDNMDTNDKMHTSCGSLALKDFYAPEDAFLVKKLRTAGAVILGKTNMTEWANFMSDRMTNGWSSRGGQVVNPYGLFDVGGSSSGGAAAIAMNMAAVAIGTETTGSIINPATQNSLVGIKPTVGAISRGGIIPLAHTQDTPGPMARTVKDATLVFQHLVGKDLNDPVSHLSTQFDTVQWSSLFDENALQGIRLGIPRQIFEHEASKERLKLFSIALKKLTDAGAILVDPIDLGTMENDLGYDVLVHEFKAGLNAYLGRTPASNPIRTLQDIIQFNNEHATETLKFGQVMLERAQRTSGTLTEQLYIEMLIKNRHLAAGVALGKALEENSVHALVFPQDHGCSFGAAAGFPSVTVPANYSEAGEPFGLTFSGSAFTEPQLISYAYAFEQLTIARKKP